MIRSERAGNRRRTAAHIVEFAVVSPVLFLMLFGIFEYSRYVMTLQIMTNAAREGARYAVVTTNDSNSNPTLDVQNYVFSYMAGQSVQLTAPNGNAFDPTVNIMVYACDPSTGLPVNSSGTIYQWSQVPTDANGNPLPWQVAPYTNAGFNQTISVVISGNFQPILPSFLMMGTNVPVYAEAVMYSEGN